MGGFRCGTVGYSYRDWMGIFYPPGTPPRRQLAIYSRHFDACELTQFTHQMPDPDRMEHFAAQARADIRFFVRIHNTFTHCTDAGMALTIARHFRKAMEPLAREGKLGGLVAAFPYAWKDTQDNRAYIEQLDAGLRLGDVPFQLDFRHPGWFRPEAIEWMGRAGLGLVCVDEPSLPGLVPARAVATAGRVLVRMHGRNAESWWSGNPTTRHDYLYSAVELAELADRYTALIPRASDVTFLFQNHWQAQSVRNALEWKELLLRKLGAPLQTPVLEPGDDDAARPRSSLTLSEIKSRVKGALSGFQTALDLPPRDPDL